MTPPASPSTRFPWPLALLIATLAAAFLSLATDAGLTLDDDGFSYLESSKNIAAGQGYAFAIPPDPLAPVIHFPPLHPVVLAGLQLFIKEPLAAARFWNILCLGFEVLVVFEIVWSATGRRRDCAVFGALLFGFHPQMLEMHSGVLSEPLFLLLLLGSLAATLRYAALPDIRWLATAALFAGFAGLARYSGMLHIGLLPIIVLRLAEGPWSKRVRAAALSAAFVALPQACWAVRNFLVAQAANDRTLHWHPLGQAHLQEAALTFSGWLFPWRFVGLGSGLLVALLFTALLIVLCRTSDRTMKAFGIFAGIYSLGYLGHLAAAICLLHYNTPLDARLLLPVLAIFLPTIAVFPSAVRHRFARLAMAALCLGLLGTEILRTRAWAADPHRLARGQTAPHWATDPAIVFLHQQPASTALWSNSRGRLYLQLQRPVRMIPFKRDSATTELIPNAEAALDRITANAWNERTFLVYFHATEVPIDFAIGGNNPASIGHFQDFTLAELQARLPLHSILRSRAIEVFQVGD